MADTTVDPTLDPDRSAGAVHGLRLVVGIAAVVITLDQLSKAWAVHALDGSRRDVLGSVFGFQLTRNPGAAFSIATGSTWIFTVLAVVVAVVIVRLARRLRSRLWGVALGLLLGGAVGNLSDRLLRAPGFARGHVVDFLELPHWPIFNLADSAICCAAALIVLASLLGVGIDGRPERGPHLPGLHDTEDLPDLPELPERS